MVETEIAVRKKPEEIKYVLIDIKEPMVMSNSIEFNKINLICGANGAGKTLILIITFAISEIAKIFCLGFQIGKIKSSVARLNDKSLLEAAQFIMDSCLTDQNIDGTIGIEYDSGSSIRFEINKGKVEFIILENWEGVEDVTGIQYMSSAMRTFDAISHYLTARKYIKKATKDNHEEIIKELCSSYRFYDIIYIEKLIAKMPAKIPPTISEAFKSFDIKEEIIEFDVDLDRGDFFITEKDNKKKYLTSYGKGHQSIFNMLLGNM